MHCTYHLCGFIMFNSHMHALQSITGMTYNDMMIVFVMISLNLIYSLLP
jgi:hypothetical protein